MARAALCLTAPMLAVAPSSGRTLRIGIPLYAADGRIQASDIARLRAHLGPEDIVFVRCSGGWRPLLAEAAGCRVAVIRQSVADLARDAEALAREGVRPHFLCYNPEAFASSHTPEAELRDLEGAVKEARALARRLGARLIVVPDTRATLVRWGPRIARHADLVAIQCQRWQRLPDEEFRRRVEAAVALVRSANPRLPVIAQLSTDPPAPAGERAGGKRTAPASAEEIRAKIGAIGDLVDGVGFLLFTADDGVGRLEACLRGLR